MNSKKLLHGSRLVMLLINGKNVKKIPTVFKIAGQALHQLKM